MDRNKHTLAFPLRRLSSTDFTSTSFTANTPTTTKPSGDNVIDLQDVGIAWVTDHSHVPDLVQIHPYGSDANNEDFAMRVFGWSDTQDSSVDDIWIPSLICELNVTLGNIAATDLGTNMFLPDTITLEKGSSDLVKVTSPTGDLPAYVFMDISGHKLLEFDFDLDAVGSAAASANVLLRGVS